MWKIIILWLIVAVLFLIYLILLTVFIIRKGRTKDNYIISQKLARQYRSKLYQLLKS